MLGKVTLFLLYRIDLLGVVSKHIGETEKNLSKIFHEAESSNAILFFDEADAILASAQKRRANMIDMPKFTRCYSQME